MFTAIVITCYLYITLIYYYHYQYQYSYYLYLVLYHCCSDYDSSYHSIEFI